ncbi:hypothetical protein NFC73_02295 [Pseudarthrobacter sp. RMG13]|uniref:Secreted protein n=1 Tax=Pseudarthrobacter humi TaxID=2952523 RepID=A0ABT1LJF3_9MICC|nr:hypothetical protein [Pseudarthrobacter humi]MCP8998569.1 hypothetical protein [Pseudarthrobacter humi]
MFKKSLAAAGLAAAFVFVPTAANALDCTNVSRPPAACGADCTAGPVIKGNWAWLPSVFPGAAEVWAFVPPGSLKVLDPTAPIGQKGNFQNGEGFALLVNAICESNGSVLVHRQTEHGIQLGEGCP